MENLGINDNFNAEVIRQFGIAEQPQIGSIWAWEHWRDGKLIDSWAERNLMAYEGLNHILDVTFSDATQITDWYIAIFEDDFTPASNNTYAVPHYTESTAYTEANRPGWQEGGVTARSITNSANKASFSINATKTIYGASLVGGGTGADTKGDAAGGGTLMCVSRFATGGKSVENGDTLKVTVTISLTGSGASSSSSSSSNSSSSSSSSS